MFWIADEGPGVREDELKMLTKRFYRRQPKSDISGSGLGLSIVEWIVLSHGGSMEIKNVERGGLKILIGFPV